MLNAYSSRSGNCLPRLEFVIFYTSWNGCGGQNEHLAVQCQFFRLNGHVDNFSHATSPRLSHQHEAHYLELFSQSSWVLCKVHTNSRVSCLKYFKLKSRAQISGRQTPDWTRGLPHLLYNKCGGELRVKPRVWRREMCAQHKACSKQRNLI
jgi:hypothetical protein